MQDEQQLNRLAKAVGVTCAAMIVLSGQTALAQSANPPNSSADQVPHMTALAACVAITDRDQRLACYDRLVPSLIEGQANGEIVVLDQAQTEVVRREAFGFRMPSLPRLVRRAGGTDPTRAAQREPEEEIESQTFTVVRTGSRANGMTIVTSNEQTWQLVEPREIVPLPRGNFNVRIRQAALGSFIMQIEGRNRGYRVRRLD